MSVLQMHAANNVSIVRYNTQITDQRGVTRQVLFSRGNKRNTNGLLIKQTSDKPTALARASSFHLGNLGLNSHLPFFVFLARVRKYEINYFRYMVNLQYFSLFTEVAKICKHQFQIHGNFQKKSFFNLFVAFLLNIFCILS